MVGIDLGTGRLGQQYTLSSENEVSEPESIIFVNGNAALPLIAWADKASNSVKVNIVGSKNIHSIGIENPGGAEIHDIQIQAPQHPNGPSQFLIQYEVGSESWADVYNVDYKSLGISKSYSIPKSAGSSAFTATARDGNLYFTHITNSKISIYSSTADTIIGTWDLKSSGASNTRHATSEVIVRGATVAVRFAKVEESGDWVLVRNGEVEWIRPESLTDATIAAWADVNGGEALAHDLEVEGHQSISTAYIHRLTRHAKDLQEHLPSWLQELPVRILSSFLPDGEPNLSEFGFGKLVIVATRNGRLAALDSGRQGKLLWNIKASDTTDDWNVNALTTEHGVATVYVDDGSIIKVNTLTGEIIERSSPAQKLATIAFVSDAAVGVESNGHLLSPSEFNENDKFIVTLNDNGKVLGWRGGNTDAPAWEFLPPQGQKIIHASARPAHDPVASIGKVLGNRSVLYKYLNPNAALLTAVTDSTAVFYLIDGVSGRILHTTTHQNVDTSQTITATLSENWFAYSLWSDVNESSDAKGYQLVISELYESSIPNDRGVLGDAANYSSIHNDVGIPRPHVISQAYMIREPISNMAVTQTRQGITIRQLLCTLPFSNAIVGIPRPALDPRRPVDRDPTAQEAEEGLVKYSPFMDFDPRWHLTHSREVMGIQNIESSPTLLESSTLIFAYGFDIFGTRLAPSQPFDLLGKSFSKVQLLLTVVALGAGVAALAPIVRFFLFSFFFSLLFYLTVIYITNSQARPIDLAPMKTPFRYLWCIKQAN